MAAKKTDENEVKNEVKNEARKKGTFPEVQDFERRIFIKKGVEKDINGTSFEIEILLDLSKVPLEAVYAAAAEHYHIRLVRKQVINVSHKDALLKMKDPIDIEALRSASRRCGQRDPLKVLKGQIAKLRAKGFSKEEILEWLEE